MCTLWSFQIKFVCSSLFVFGLVNSIGGYLTLTLHKAIFAQNRQWNFTKLSKNLPKTFSICYGYFSENQEMIFWIPPGTVSIIVINRPIKKPVSQSHIYTCLLHHSPPTSRDSQTHPLKFIEMFYDWKRDHGGKK